MKIILLPLAILTIVLIMYSRTPPRPRHVHEPLPPGETSGVLEHIGLADKLLNGAPVHFRTNFTRCGILRDYSEAYRFPDGTFEPAILIRWNDGSEEWLRRKTMSHVWIGQQPYAGRTSSILFLKESLFPRE